MQRIDVRGHVFMDVRIGMALASSNTTTQGITTPNSPLLRIAFWHVEVRGHFACFGACI